MLVVDSRSLTKPHSTELTCTFEYAAPQMGVSTNNVLASDTMVDINMARLLLHDYLASGVWAILHKANFVLNFITL